MQHIGTRQLSGSDNSHLCRAMLSGLPHPRILHTLFIPICLQPLEITDLSPVSRVVPSPECLRDEAVQHMWPIQIGSFHSINCILVPSVSFLGLIAHFFFMLNNIPVFGWASVYLSLHRLKDILAASKFANYE